MIKCLEAIAIIRILRLTIYLEEIKTFRIIVETLKALLSPFWSMITVIFSIFYVYAFMGIIIFGGKVSYDSAEIALNNEVSTAYWALNNFNDFLSAFVTLFELMIVNNWMITA